MKKITMLKIQYDDGDILTICSDFVDGKSTSCVWQDKKHGTQQNIVFWSHGILSRWVDFIRTNMCFFDDQGNRS